LKEKQKEISDNVKNINSLNELVKQKDGQIVNIQSGNNKRIKDLELKIKDIESQKSTELIDIEDLKSQIQNLTIQNEEKN